MSAWWNDPQIPIIDVDALVKEWTAALHEAAQFARTVAITRYIGRKRPEYPPLADETVRRKGHDRPLLESARMRNSIQAVVSVTQFGGEWKCFAVVGTNVEYARAQEFGTLKSGGFIPPRPFLEPAVEEARKRLERRLGNAPAEAIRYV